MDMSERPHRGCNEGHAAVAVHREGHMSQRDHRRSEGTEPSSDSSKPVSAGSTIKPRYGVDEMPPLGEGMLLGLQHVLVMMASNVTIPIILATAIGATTGETTFLVQVALLVAGLTTLIQTFGIGPIGARLPIVQGTSFGFL